MDDIANNVISESYFYSIRLTGEDIAKTYASLTNRKTSREEDSTLFNVGAYVRATYLDGTDYEAKIISIDNDSCKLRYIGYNNEECFKLKDLLPSWGKTARRSQYIKAKKVISDTKEIDEKSNPENMETSFCDWIPPPPPISIRSMVSEADSEESEQLYNMLMSWYMTGFYSGLHQGFTIYKKKL